MRGTREIFEVGLFIFGEHSIIYVCIDRCFSGKFYKAYIIMRIIINLSHIVAVNSKPYIIYYTDFKIN